MALNTYVFAIVTPTTRPTLIAHAPPDRPLRVLLWSFTGGAAVFATDQSQLLTTPQEGYSIRGVMPFADVLILAPKEKLYGMNLVTSGVTMAFSVHTSDAAFEVLDDGGGVL